MTFGSLFAGIGGLDLGLERAGMTCKWQVEIDEFCQKVLTKHWPHVPKFRDIRDCGAHNLPPVDLICGGFPCQPFSVAGKQRGASDDRYLWPEMRRVIEELRPAWVLGENVPGIIRMGIDTALADLEALGYSCRTLVFPACALGAPHIRARVWVVAYGNNGYGQSKHEIRTRRNLAVFDGNDVGHSSTFRFNGLPKKNADVLRFSREASNKEPEKGGPEICCGESRQQSWPPTPARFDAWDAVLSERPNLEPSICGVAHGVPSRVDRLKSLGNAVVPQCAEFIGRRIMEGVKNREFI